MRALWELAPAACVIRGVPIFSGPHPAWHSAPGAGMEPAVMDGRARETACAAVQARAVSRTSLQTCPLESYCTTLLAHLGCMSVHAAHRRRLAPTARPRGRRSW